MSDKLSKRDSASLLREKAELEHRYKKLLEEYQALKREHAEAMRSFNEIRNAQSWKVTKPVRFTLDFLKGKTQFQLSKKENSNLEIITVRNYKKLKFSNAPKPLVSIVIPVYNHFDYTYRCLLSVLQNTEGIAYEVIVADDGSDDETKKIQKYISGIRVIRNPKNLQFLLNCNHAAVSAKGEYILFLNNDTQVRENWLLALLQTMKDKTVGLVGSKLIQPDGTIQEAGGIVFRDASAWNYGRGFSMDDSDCNFLRETDYVSGASMLIRKSLWEQIGGFDVRFQPAYYEDTDLAFEVRKKGFRVLYQPLSEVIHFESVSNGTDKDSVHEKQMKKNRKLFYEKWKNVLKKEHFENGQDLFLARDRSAHKKHLLMIDHRVPEFDTNAGDRFVYNYLQLFLKHGFRITFLPDNFHPSKPYTDVLTKDGIQVLYGEKYRNGWEKFFLENGKYFSHAFMNRPDQTNRYIDLFRSVSTAKVVYFGHDLHFLRELREYEITKNPNSLAESNRHKKIEFDVMRKADMVYYPSCVEKEIIQKTDPHILVKAIPLYLYDSFTPVHYSAEKRKNLLFVGGFGHPPNRDAVLWFAKEILPQIKVFIPDICLTVVGANPPKEILDLNSGNIDIKGFVTDEELKHCYETSRMCVVPLRYGAGVKGKIVEAMRYGMPVITTKIGAEGIENAEDAMIIRESAKEIADAIISLYENKKALSDYSKKASEYVKKVFSFENAANQIRSEFDL